MTKVAKTASPTPGDANAGDDEAVAGATDQLASVEVSRESEGDEHENSDTTPPTAPPKEDVSYAEHPELWKPHPPMDDCPVCFVPLPLKTDERIFFPCCGKLLCRACVEEYRRALFVTNAKRDKKELPPLVHSCAFCRTASPDNDAELVSQMKLGMEKDCVECIRSIADKHLKGTDFPKDEGKAFELYQRAAKLGSADALTVIGRCYVGGYLGAAEDNRKGIYYKELAAAKGSVYARRDLALACERVGFIDLAIKHWQLSATAGDEKSVKELWKCFYKGKLSKVDLEDTLRAHKDSLDEMNSEDRERYNAWQDAKSGDDELLLEIYDSYYSGKISAKMLKKVLKAHRMQSGGAR